jgi:hypothetical protein
MSVAENVYEKVRNLSEHAQRLVLEFVEDLQVGKPRPNGESFVERGQSLGLLGPY